MWLYHCAGSLPRHPRCCNPADHHEGSTGPYPALTDHRPSDLPPDESWGPWTQGTPTNRSKPLLGREHFRPCYACYGDSQSSCSWWLDQECRGATRLQEPSFGNWPPAPQRRTAKRCPAERISSSAPPSAFPRLPGPPGAKCRTPRQRSW